MLNKKLKTKSLPVKVASYNKFALSLVYQLKILVGVEND